MINTIVSLGKREAQLIVAIFGGCLLLGFALSYFYVKLSSQKSVFPKIVAGRKATLTLTSDKKEVKKGEKFSITIELDTKDQGVEAADFVVNFDPQYFKPVKITEGKFFKLYPVKKVENNFVKISGMANLEGNTILIPKGKGPVALIVFQAEKETRGAKINFDKKKTIVASAGKNILGKTNEVKVRITEK